MFLIQKQTGFFLKIRSILCKHVNEIRFYIHELLQSREVELVLARGKENARHVGDANFYLRVCDAFV